MKNSEWNKFVLALDFSSFEEVMKCYENYGHHFEWFKVGMQLFYAHGNEILEFLQERNKKVFLDLKLHDIPNTVSGAIQSLSKYHVNLLTIHLHGGKEMLKAAVKARDQFLPQCELMGVVYLTSLSQQDLRDDLFIAGNSAENMLSIGKWSHSLGCDGLVCSGLEVQNLKTNLPQMKFLTPGIRWKENTHSDQKRVVRPEDALKWGSDYIIIGRGLTQSQDPIREVEYLKGIGYES
jgi:orotidine-5'-phosphate decarboxylase